MSAGRRLSASSHRFIDAARVCRPARPVTISPLRRSISTTMMTQSVWHLAADQRHLRSIINSFIAERRIVCDAQWTVIVF